MTNAGGAEEEPSWTGRRGGQREGESEPEPCATDQATAAAVHSDTGSLVLEAATWHRARGGELRVGAGLSARACHTRKALVKGGSVQGGLRRVLAARAGAERGARKQRRGAKAGEQELFEPRGGPVGIQNCSFFSWKGASRSSRPKC